MKSYFQNCLANEKMKKIKLTQGKEALISDQDYKLVSQYKWYAHYSRGHWYALSSISKNKKIRMHRLIMGLNFKDKYEIDHINHNGLDNRRNNLRICTHQQNMQNRKSLESKGVTWHKRDKKWQVQVFFKRKLIHIGYFNSKIDAITTRNATLRLLKNVA